MKKSLKITLIIVAAAIAIAAVVFTATSIYQNSPSYRLTLAERYLSEMNYEQAIIEFEKLVQIEPQNVDYWLKLAEAYEKNGQLDKAKETLERALTYVDDDRIRMKLAELELLINPPVTTAAVTTSTTTAPITTSAPVTTEPEPVYAEYVVNEAGEGNIYSRGNGVLVSYKEDDKLYAFASDDGNLLTGYDYSQVNSFFGTEDKTCGYVETPDGKKKYVTSSGETIVDVTNASHWFVFNKEEPLVAVFYEGKVVNEIYAEDNSFREWDSDYASFKIFRYDGSLIYEYNDGNGLRGTGTVPSVNDPGMPTDIPLVHNCNSDLCQKMQENGVVFNLKDIDISIYYLYGASVSNDKLIINMNIMVGYEHGTLDEMEKAKEDIKREWLAEHPDAQFYVSASGDSAHIKTWGGWYEVNYSDGKITLVKSEHPAPYIRGTDEYSIYMIARRPTFATDLYMQKNRNTYHSVISSDMWDTSKSYGFSAIGNSIFKDFAVCYKQNNSGEYVAALFKPAWYNTSAIEWDIINEKAQSEWMRLSDWYTNIGVINAERGLFWVYDPTAEEDDENNNVSIYHYNIETGEFTRISEYFNDLFWDNDIPEAVVGKKADVNSNSDSSDNDLIITRALYICDTEKNEASRISEWYSSLSLSNSKYMLVSKGDKWGYIDNTGKEYEMFDDASDFSNGYAVVTVNGEGWLINEEFEQMSEKFPCESAHVISDGKFAITCEEGHKIISITG